MSHIAPLRTILKSSDVEDPVNIYLHRTLAYGFVRAVYRTRMTPDMITLLTVIPGLLAGAMFLWGTRGAMVAGGLLLWSSAILDGADGLLARAKNMSSVYGRAHDALADVVVAIVTVFPAFLHVYLSTKQSVYLWLMLPTIGLAAIHMSLYDFYKELYLNATKPGRKTEDVGEAELRQLSDAAANPISRLAIDQILLPLSQRQHRLLNWTNPIAWTQSRTIESSEQVAQVYRKHNLGPMRLWTAISSAPHSYLISICAIADRLDIYFWVRLVGMNLVMLVAMLWQRHSTEATHRELQKLEDVEEHRIPALQAAA
jgi:phosphatidylglycerophosphate synthase